MLDFTQEIPLESKDYKYYRKFQFFLYLIAFFVALYLSYLIAFPHKLFLFNFSNPTASENNIYNPRVENALYPENGIVLANKNLLFNTNITSDYSKANVNLILAKPVDKKFSIGDILLKRSYQSFLFPEGNPKGFRKGSLLKKENDFLFCKPDLITLTENLQMFYN